MRLKSYLPEYMFKDLLMRFSALLTCSIICFISLNNLNIGAEFYLKLIAFISFYLAFVVVTSAPPTAFQQRDKLLLLLQTSIALLLIKFDTYDIAAILLVFVSTQLAIRFSRKQAISIIVAIAAAHTLVIYNGHILDALSTAATFLMLQMFGFSAIECFLREEQAKEEVSAINQELLATRFMLKAASERKERLRISRDLHDVIGHQLTSLVLNLEVSQHKVSDEFKPLLEQNLGHARTLLSEVRSVVKEMRVEEEFDLVEKLSSLIGELPECQLKVTSIPHINTQALKQQVMYCLQEGVSNAIRHGKANQFTLSSEQDDKQLTLYLADNGTVKPSNQFGCGLTGMQERLAEFQGTIELLPSSSGCTLKIQVQDM